MIRPPTFLVVIAVAVGALLLLKGCDAREPTPHRAERSTTARKPLLQQIEVEGTREIAPHQTVTVLRIPDPLVSHSRLMDRHCLIYEHHEFRTVQIMCDGMSVGGAVTNTTEP